MAKSFTVTPGAGDFETVAASQDQALGAAGARGDFIKRLIIVPTAASPGSVTIEDAATQIPIFQGGTSDVRPIVIELDIFSKEGGWSVQTGLNVTVIAVGKFTN